MLAMRRLLLLILFLLGFGVAIATFSGVAARGTYDSIVLDFREDIPAAQLETGLAAIAQKYQVKPHLNSVFSQSDHVYVVDGNAKLLKALRQSKLAKLTEAIEPNYLYHAFLAPNDPFYSQQWNLRSINVEAAWDETKGNGVTVAVIDTGVTRVPDLQQTNLVAGYDFVNDRVDATDDHGHGTHVAGTIAQSTNNNYGVAGIAYEASIMPLKVLDGNGGGTVADIAEAIKFAADHDADVVNMSLGGFGDSELIQEAIAYAHQKGVVIIAAAGNSNQNAAAYPARYPHVIGVSALSPSGSKASYSNFGAGVDIAAPGGELQPDDNGAGGILQNTINPETNEPILAAYQGTSMAAPHVAGVAALVKASGITDADQVREILIQSARTVKDDALNHYGAGHLDASSAVKLALRGQITFRDFFRWLRDNGYLNPRFWIDGGAVALLPKIAMVLGSYLLAWFLRNYLPFWSWSLTGGLVTGSAGLFFLRGFYIVDAPQWPFRVLGSSIPELGTAIQGTGMLNPIFASVLIPFGLLALFLGHSQWKWFAIGTTLGVASCLAVSAVMSPQLLWLGSGAIARLFLIGNALLCFGLAYLATRGEQKFT